MGYKVALNGNISLLTQKQGRENNVHLKLLCEK